MPQIGQEESNITSAIAAGGELEPLVARLKALKAERQDVELRLTELDADERDLRATTAAVERLREEWGGWIAALDAAAEGTVPETALQVARQILRKVVHMVIYVVPGSRDAWTFHGAADVDGGRYVRDRVGRDSAVVIEDCPGGGLRYTGFAVDRPIAGGCGDGGGAVRGEDMAPTPPALVAPRYSRGGPRQLEYMLGHHPSASRSRSPIAWMCARSPGTSGQSKPLPSSFQRGMRCRW